MKPESIQPNQLIELHPSIPDKVVSRESSILELKESFNWGSRDSYAKSMAAFANNKGGFLVFGVTNHPRMLKGLLTNNFEDIDEEKITSYLNSVFSPEIEYAKSVVEVNSKKIGFIQVFQSRIKPIVCIKNDNELKESDIYYRYIARSERIKYPALKIILDQVAENERKSWMKHFENISKIGPTNAAVLDVIGGNVSGSTGALVIDRKLLPKLRFISEGTFKEFGRPVLKLIGSVKPVMVTENKLGVKSTELIQVTNNPSAPMVRIDENDVLKRYPLSYKDLTDKLKSKYFQFKLDKKFQGYRQKLIKDSKFAWTRFLDPGKPKGTQKVFYSPLIVKEIGKQYKRKRKKIPKKR